METNFGGDFPNEILTMAVIPREICQVCGVGVVVMSRVSLFIFEVE